MTSADRPDRTTVRISTAADGGEADYDSYQADISSDGRFIAYASAAGNLVPADTNGRDDVFVYDTRTRTSELVSHGVGGTPSNGHSHYAKISGNGRYVVFVSTASNLVAGDTGGPASDDVFLHDRRTGKTVMVTHYENPQSHNVAVDISDDGRYIAYTTYAKLVPEDTNDELDVYVYQRDTTRVTLASRTPEGTAPVQGALFPVISGNGRYVAYTAASSELSPDGTPAYDALVHDRVEQTTTPVSVDDTGADAVATSLSDDGRFITYQSDVSASLDDTDGDDDVFVYDRRTRSAVGVSTPHGGTGGAVSGNGRYVVFQSDTHPAAVRFGQEGIIRYDRLTREYVLVSEPVDDAGHFPPLNNRAATISRDGSSIAYDSADPDEDMDFTWFNIYLTRLHPRDQ
jgi:Tol biopolymer transport system component